MTLFKSVESELTHALAELCARDITDELDVHERRAAQHACQVLTIGGQDYMSNTSNLGICMFLAAIFVAGISVGIFITMHQIGVGAWHVSQVSDVVTNKYTILHFKPDGEMRK